MSRGPSRAGMAAMFAALLGGLSVTCGGGAPAAPGTGASTASTASALQAELDRWALGSGHYGVSASVVFSDGSAWSGVAGRASGTELLRPDHLIAIGSITKTMTGAVILQLADEGRLTLDDRIDRWLPPQTNVDPGITVRQLLNHTNGLDNYTATAGLSAAISANPSRLFTPAELLAFIGPPHFAPGNATEYTNTAFLLLGQIAERAGGRDIVDLWRTRVWNPLGWTDVFLPGDRSAPGPVADALTSGGVRAPLDYMGTLTAASTAFGLMATARGVARWGHALFAGTVVSSRMQAEMRVLVPASGSIPGESGVGLGIRGYAYLGRSQIGHSGGSAFGTGLLIHDPAARVTVTVLMNQGQGADHFTLAPALLSIALKVG